MMWLLFLIPCLFMNNISACDEAACNTGIAVGAGICGVGATIAGIFTAGIAAPLVGAGCAAASLASNACSLCGSAASGSAVDNAFANMDDIVRSLRQGQIEQNQYFDKLNENDKRIILNQAKLLANQNTIISGITNITAKTEELGKDISNLQIISLYGQSEQDIKNVIKHFALLTYDPFGRIEKNYLWDRFYTAAKEYKLQNSINNIFDMLAYNNLWKQKSLWSYPSYCTETNKQYIQSLLIQGKLMQSIALASEGIALQESDISTFKTQFIQSDMTYYEHCDCKQYVEALSKRNSLVELLQLGQPDEHQNFYKEVIFHTSQDLVLMQKLLLLFQAKPFFLSEESVTTVSKHPLEDFKLIESLGKFGLLDELVLYENSSFCASTRICSTLCNYDGGWSTWSEFSFYSVAKTRNRTCSIPPPSNRGESCLGLDEEVVSLDPRPSPSGEYSDPVLGCIRGLNSDVSYGLTLEECKSKCSAATSFACNSMDYFMKERKCHLSRETKNSRPDAYSSPCYTHSTESFYLERQGEYSDPVKGCIRGLNSDEMYGLTLEGCKSKCSAATSFACKSIDYFMKARKCHLSRETKKSRPDAYSSPCYTHSTESFYLERQEKLSP